MKKNVLSDKVTQAGRLFLPFCLLALVPSGVMAQDDDMYFVPTKENKALQKQSYGMPRDTYYSGSQRSVDDYNSASWSTVTPIDSLGNDIIDFSAVQGVYPDSTYSETGAGDFEYTRRMSRFDDYTPSEAYWDGYRDGSWPYTRYYSWYDPWYDPWYYGGWYYGGWYGYYRPWYWSWSYPRYYSHHPYRHYGGHGYYRGGHSVSAGGYRGFSNGRQARSLRRTTAPARGFGQSPGGSRSSRGGSYSGSTRSSGSSFGGGGHSGGGFGGGRGSGGGGRSFGSRR